MIIRPVGALLKTKLASFEKALSIKYIDVEQLGIINDAELKYAVKGTKSFIIAADNLVKSEKKWFGSMEMPNLLSEKNLKVLHTIIHIC